MIERLTVSILAVCLFLPATSRAAKPVTFESQVRPILKAHCFQCHGEESELSGNLDLRAVRPMLAGGDSGPAVMPGKPGDSLLLSRIEAGEMPKGKKKLSDDEIAAIRNWIEAGAKTARPEPVTAAAAFTPEEKSFWSFQPLRHAKPPRVKAVARVRTPVDAFLLARLERDKLTFSPEADKRTLIRRATFDLIGLPPTPEAVEQFVADDAPDAWERLIDRLLASPQYGERWGRHWLDLAGYADSEGYSEKDIVRQHAYKYRDYVIRSLNQDKPLDEFIQEQLAGDELAGVPGKALAPGDAEKLIATGFLRMAPDGTADAADQGQARNDVMAETIKIVSTSLLGLSVGCAQCHNHRYEPISQVDYYRFRAIFEPAYDWKAWRNPQKRLVPLFSEEEKKQQAECDRQLKQLDAERTRRLIIRADEVFEQEIAKQPEELREQLRAARKVRPAIKRTAEQDKLARKYKVVDVNARDVRRYDPEVFDAELKEYEGRVAVIKARRPREEFAHALTEVPGKVPATYVFIRGDHQQPADEVKPGELSVLSRDGDAPIPEKDGSLRTTGRRLAYARHLTDGHSPLVPRVLVNRVWLEHFGRGIVATPSDFGLRGDRPTHPELLDWLASEFVASGWRLKPLHKTIMMSAAYRQSSRHTDRLDHADPENNLLGRMAVRRLDAEAIRDAMLAVAGNLNSKMGGPPVPVMPDEVGQIVLGIDTRDGAGRPNGKFIPLGEELYRRSVYIQVRRTMPLEMLATFDAPVMTPNCELRASSTVAPQSLLLLNDDFVIEQALVFARRVQKEATNEPADQVRLAWRRAFAKEPTEAQVSGALEFLAAQEKNFAKKPAVKSVKGQKPVPQVEPSLRALAAFCQALAGSNGFLYID